MNTTLKSPRIEVVDALRGFAIMSIMLLHNLEHFDIYYFPEQLPAWMKVLDGKIWNTLFFLFSGKSYAIFALLFGFSFYLMFNKQKLKGNDFRGRFLWRMLWLLGFGLINGLLYDGDILAFYAVLGISLVLVCKFSNRALLITALFLILQPLEWVKFIYCLIHPEFVPSPNLSGQYFAAAFPYVSGDSFLNLIKGNFTNGRIANICWSWENGRFFQTPGLFMLGLWIGRKGYLHEVSKNKKFWIRTGIVAVIAFVVLFILKSDLHSFFARQVLTDKAYMIINSWANFAFMWILVTLFLLGYQSNYFYKITHPLTIFGRMSLTNYVMQSMMGAFVYNGFGLALYKYTGATYCLLIGIVLFIIQLQFCRIWLKYHKQGPLEYLWHKATWIKSKSA
jgi:uncharacterized protein